MNMLNKIVAYWLGCLRREDALGQELDIRNPAKAALCPFEYDPFIFNRAADAIDTNDANMRRVIGAADGQDKEMYYGYPLLFYYDNNFQQQRVAPLFVIKVDYEKRDAEISLSKDESIPSCGAQALAKMGLQAEEIAELNKKFEEVFSGGISEPNDIVKKCLAILKEAANFSEREEINPDALTNNAGIPARAHAGLYNKSVLFSGENTFFNKSLINDLTMLQSRSDIGDTALGFIGGGHSTAGAFLNKPLVLPFPINEYQTQAIQSAIGNKLSVVTGPPGTGKSQFIANLLINLFLNGKTVLLVSHTNDAVDVVNEKINNEFNNLLLRTGGREARENLAGVFNRIILDSQKQRATAAEHKAKRIYLSWDKMRRLKEKLLRIDEWEKAVTELPEIQKLKKSVINAIKIAFFTWRLKGATPKIDIEREIKRLEDGYFQLSREYVKAVYIKMILSEPGAAGKAEAFLAKVRDAAPEQDIEEEFCVNAIKALRVWSSTLNSLNRTFSLKAGLFDYVIFDEASQIGLPSAAGALYRAKKAVVVGDQMQLSHIAKITQELDEDIAKSYGVDAEEELYPSKIRYYDVSLYKCAASFLDEGNHPTLLVKHYRSEDQIINLCNTVFYGGQLTISSELDSSALPSEMLGMHWWDCEGKTIMPRNGSRVNTEEADAVNDVLQRILKHVEGTDLTIGIVTPYSRQKRKIEELVSDSTSPEVREKHQIKVATAHRFQGSEKDIMIFSVVLAARGEGNNDNWYNAQKQILNVALSRARYSLSIVGDKQFCLNRNGNAILRKIAETYEHIKKQEMLEQKFVSGKFDSKYEEILYRKLQKENLAAMGLRLVSQYREKRYSLDIAIIGDGVKIDIECDGFGAHSIINGLPVIEDVERDEYLTRRGWTVLRFPNYKIIKETDKVIAAIMRACQENAE